MTDEFNNDIPEEVWEEALSYANGEEDTAVLLATISLESGVDVESAWNCIGDSL
jgi:hypothetical protein